jgi:hypothetical protein
MSGIKLKQIEFYIQTALDRCHGKEVRRVSDALKPVLPDVIKTLHRFLLDEHDIATKKFAITMLELFWARLLTDSRRETKNLTDRERLKVRAKRVKVAETQATLGIAAERKRIQKTLDRHIREIQQQSQQ